MSWDLPPGVTNKDIDDAAGSGEAVCERCEKEVEEIDDHYLCEECAKVHQEELDEQETME